MSRVTFHIFVLSLAFSQSWAQTTIYSVDFNSSDESWTNSGTSNWIRGNLDFTSGADGNYWAFPNTGAGYANNADATLTSPDISTKLYKDLALSVDVRYDVENDDDGFHLQYSEDGGTTWTVLGDKNEGNNWYGFVNIDVFGEQPGWSNDNLGWQTATIDLPKSLENNCQAQFRFVFESDANNPETGVAFDNFIISGTLIAESGSPTGSTSPGNANESMLLWLRPDSGIAVSSDRPAWNDWSGNGLSAVGGGTGCASPSYTLEALNGYDIFTFDGTDDYFDLGDVLNLTGQTDRWTFFCAYNTNTTGTLLSRASSATTTSRQYQYLVSGGNLDQIIGGTTSLGTSTVTGGWQVHTSITDGSNTNTFSGGAADISAGSIGTAVETTNVLMGARSSGTGELFNGDIAEIIVFYDTVSTSTRRDVETYFAIKYGITLDLTSQDYTVNGTSIFDNTDFTSYSSDIAGIGVDISQGLSQTQGESASGGILNISNASSLDDGDYMVWGHDNAASTTTTANVPSGVSNRLNRIWRVNEVNEVGTIDVTFDLTTLGLSGRVYNLLIMSSGASLPGDISSATVSSTGNISNVNGRDLVTFTGVSLNDNEYFTLGISSVLTGPGDAGTNIQVWLRGDVGITQSNSVVSTWNDQSGNANNATQTTTASRPAYVADGLNGNPVLQFDGTDDQISGSGFYGQDMYFVIAPDEPINSSTSHQALIALNNADFRGIFFSGFTGLLSNELISYSETGPNYRVGYISSSTVFDYPMIVNFRNNSGATAQELYLNDSLTTTTESGTFGNDYNLGVTYEIGENGVGGDYYNGRIAEVISFSTRQTDANRRSIASYLALKYGIALDVSSTGYFAGSDEIYGHTSYGTDVAGIGRDDSQGLNQTSSKSASGNVVAVSNPSGMTDGEFFIWGHDNGSTAITTSNIPGGVSGRITRIWRIDETGDVGSVDITFDISDLGVQPGATFSLLTVANSATMPTDLSSATVAASSSVSGTNITFSSVNLDSGQYFTLGTSSSSLYHPGGISSGLSIWLNAGTGTTTTNGNVSQWADISGNGNGAAQTTTDQQPELISDGLNGNPIINFNGGTNLEGEQGFYTQDYFIVASPNELYNNNNVVGIIVGFQLNTFSSLVLGPTTSSVDNEVITHILQTGYRSLQLDTTSSYGNPSIINSRNNAGGDLQHIFIDGTQIVNYHVDSASFSNLSNSVYRLGEDYSNQISGPFNGGIAEVISYSARLSDADRRDVETYLAIKYGITLDMTSQNYTDGGVSIYNHSTYSHDIAGIGKDEATQGLNQTSSKSINSGSIIRIKDPSGMDDNEYLIWGNDNGSNAFTTSDVPSGVSERSERIWRVDETGDVGTVSVVVDLTSMAINSNFSTVNLIIASTGSTMPTDLSAGTVVSSGIVSEESGRTLVTFSGVDFSDGDFFTVGGDIQTSSPGGGSNLSLWLRADEGITTSGSLVSSWSDQSGNGNDAVQGNSSFQPSLSTNQINYNDAIYFDGDNLDGLQGFNTNDYFLVLKPDAEVNATNLIGYPIGFESGDVGGFYLGNLGILTNDVIGQTMDNPSGTGAFDAGVASTTISDSVIIFNVRNNSAGTAQTFYANGADLAETTPSGTFANLSDQSFSIGNNFTGDNKYEGYIAEVISYSDTLTSNQRRDVESYLAIKYGVTLDISAESYTSDSSDIYNYSTHANDIAGIGIHLDYGLNQTISQSTEDDGIIKVSSASNLDDEEYLIWGNDGASKSTPQTSELPSGYEERLPVEWRVDLTGSPGSVVVKIYIGGIDNFSDRPQTASLYSLLLDDNGDFSTIVSTVSATSLSDDTLTFNAVSFTDGDYFTLALPSQPVVTGLTLWLKADLEVEEANSNSAETNDIVEFWKDQSGNSNDFGQSTIARRPTYLTNQLNGNPVVNFNDDFTFMELSSTNLNPRSLFIVYRDTSTASNTTPFTNDDAGEASGIGHGHTDDSQLFNATNTPLDVRNGANYVNGTDIGDGTTQSRPDSYELHSRVFASNLSNALHNYYAGIDRGTDDRSIDGDIAEIMVYTSALTDSARRDIETYLAIKYGVTLDISTLNYTKGDPIYSQNTYANDIAGIGADSDFGLTQDSSSSINNDAIVTIGNASSLGNGEYLIWGNDNGATTETSIGVPTGFSNRLTRMWGVTETGDLGTVSITFDLTGLSDFSSKEASDFTLVVDANNDFSDGVLRSYAAESFTSSVATFINVDFTGSTNFGLVSQKDLVSDSDGDGIKDFIETAYGTNPNDSNSPESSGGSAKDTDATTGKNGDGISDALETLLINNGASAPVNRATDSDGDGIPDYIEVENGDDPFNANSPTGSGNTDSDNDGLTDAMEVAIDSAGGPANSDLTTDTDSDGIPDYFEVINNTNPNDVNSPTSSGGDDTDSDGISNGLEDVLIAAGTTSPVDTTTDSDADGIPDFIEARTNTDPYDTTSPAANITTLRTLTADYASTGVQCTDLSGYQWVDITDQSGNLVFSINPNGNNLGSTCWGIRVLTGAANVRKLSQRYFINRNWYIEPTTQPSTNVYVRLYVTDQEVTDLRSRVNTDESGSFTDANILTHMDITKIAGETELNPLSNSGGDSVGLAPTVLEFSSASADVFVLELNSFSGLEGSVNGGSGGLPVELGPVRVNAVGNGALLSWVTYSEQDNDYFEVQRSHDGNSFVAIGRVLGVGDSYERRSYDYHDQNLRIGKYYYRLMQVDRDRTFEYSEIVSVVVDRNSIYDQGLSNDLVLYPQPLDRDILLISQENLGNDDYATFELYELTGQLLKRVEVRRGEITKPIEINTNDMRNGLYLIKLITGGREYRSRMAISK